MHKQLQLMEFIDADGEEYDLTVSIDEPSTDRIPYRIDFLGADVWISEKGISQMLAVLRRARRERKRMTS